MSYTYLQSEPGLWTVGTVGPTEAWEPESDWDDRAKAAARVHYLNGGAPERTGAASELAALVERMDELGDGTNVYDLETGLYESYMIAGGGPSAWVVFLMGRGGVIENAVLMHSDADGWTFESIPGPIQATLRNKLRMDRREAERHG